MSRVLLVPLLALVSVLGLASPALAAPVASPVVVVILAAGDDAEVVPPLWSCLRGLGLVGRDDGMAALYPSRAQLAVCGVRWAPPVLVV